MEKNHNITSNDLLVTMGYTGLVVIFLNAAILSLVLAHYTLCFILVVLGLYLGRQGDNKYNEIRTKLGLR